MKVARNMLRFGGAAKVVVATVLASSVAPSASAAVPSEFSEDAERCAALARTPVDSGVEIRSSSFAPAPTTISVPPGYPGQAASKLTVTKPFCRVEVVARPEPGSEIGYEVWLPPASAWNGRFYGVGGGGFGGSITYGGRMGLAGAMEKGYAAMATDYGHRSANGADLTWAAGQTAQSLDFAFRAVHVATVGSKRLTAVYYRKPPNHSYFQGCSRGGAMAMVTAQRWFNDYDGIVAGDPARDWVRSFTSTSAYALEQVRNPAARIPATLKPMIHKAVVAQCDAVDGLVDGVVSMPGKCRFDVSKIRCKSGSKAECLSKPQADALMRIYSGIKRKNGERLADPYVLGSEMGWFFLGLDSFGPKAPYAQFWSSVVFDDLSFDPGKSLDLEKDSAFASKKVGWAWSYTDPDLSPLRRAGGKLLIYTGEADPDQGPAQTTEYYQDVVKTMGKPVADSFVHYYLVPAMGHCGGGDGPDTFDMLPAMEAWVERGVAPGPVTATKLVNGKPVRTRPLCAYPEVATYKGTGDINAAENFSCRLRR